MFVYIYYSYINEVRYCFFKRDYECIISCIL